jgi:hypothetical protein
MEFNENSTDYKIEKEIPNLIFYQLKGSESKIATNRDPSMLDYRKFKKVYGLNTIICDRKLIRDERNWTILSEFNFINFSITSEYELIDNLKCLYNLLMNEKICVILNPCLGRQTCCSIMYCLFRMNGETKESATELFLRLRSEPKNGIGDFRIEYTERYVIPHLIKTE